MIRLTNLADYGVVLMGELADSRTRLSATDLAARTGLPSPTVAKILNLLARAALIVSHRGLKGGFALARGADAISVADIIEAIDGPIALTNCIDQKDGQCDFDQICRMRGRWQKINTAVRGALDDVTLAELGDTHVGAALPGTAPEHRPAE